MILENIVLDKNNEIKTLSPEKLETKLENKATNIRKHIFKITLFSLKQDTYYKKDIKALLKDLHYLEYERPISLSANDLFKNIQDHLNDALDTLVFKLQLQLIKELQKDPTPEKLEDLKDLILKDYDLLLKYKIIV